MLGLSILLYRFPSVILIIYVNISYILYIMCNILCLSYVTDIEFCCQGHLINIPLHQLMIYVNIPGSYSRICKSDGLFAAELSTCCTWTTSDTGWRTTNSIIVRGSAFVFASPLSYLYAFLLDLSWEICDWPIGF